ncbi:MAG: hypothetical protein KKF44_10925 [Nanoarchaeota archaeon]|nr:hypothetical protein [Nanoarchaeota archaeon]
MDVNLQIETKWDKKWYTRDLGDLALKYATQLEVETIDNHVTAIADVRFKGDDHGVFLGHPESPFDSLTYNNTQMLILHCLERRT